MAIQDGDFVRVDFTGSIKETDEIFDTTSEDIAEEAGILVENKKYGPIPIIVGGNHLLPAIEEAIIGSEAGESVHVSVTPENGFGQRNPNLIQLIPMKEFKKQGMTPVRGMKISTENGNGKIISVNGGRVKVDFNHDLAGKNLEYDVTVVELIEDDEEKIKSMIELHYSYPNMDYDNIEIKFDGSTVSIKLDEITRFDQQSYMDVTFARFRISKDIWDNMDYEKVQFVDEFEKIVEEAPDEEVEAEVETEVEADAEE
ncbi:peptidyl-prolyl cis-trans isomerase [Methanobrevibacter ruminantium M1]|uniref:Peptidyl-prolyl cis-trans isomerase n=1 Tax=Methanobrevibacter ruminantium (strain ATCC 35063 / DSM 1093 / JCM 13430 / OCM 146 / M1) TaxID=634498 RepID=D3DZS3_METRM|nr:peptidylprolyl isomerase [Methanobrevibacter ruminantium]ADC47751.1 peptidyl-prolyl cis-trans isomerase [Methanobrevibacter ruminantium M1]